MQKASQELRGFAWRLSRQTSGLYPTTASPERAKIDICIDVDMAVGIDADVDIGIEIQT